jgi:hypothetical protein
MRDAKSDDLNGDIVPKPAKKQVKLTKATATKRKIEATEVWEGAKMEKVCWKKQRLELVDSRRGPSPSDLSKHDSELASSADSEHHAAYRYTSHA